MRPTFVRHLVCSLAVSCVCAASTLAQTPPAPATQPASSPTPAPPSSNPASGTASSTPTAAVLPTAPVGVAVPAGYIIGPEDVLSVVFWREKDMSTDVVVRPDGKISLPLLNEVQAAGLTPEQLRMALTESAGKLIEAPTVAVVVKTINSRRIFVTGQVSKPGPYPLIAPTTVVQFIAMAGGLTEYSDSKNIRIMRVENGKQISYKFNYKDVAKGKNLQQNIELKPGDTIIVP